MKTGIVYNIQKLSVHDGPGIRTTVFLKGCPLKCTWCSNPESQSIKEQMLYFDNLCVGCGACISECPLQLIHIENGKSSFDKSKCTDCGACTKVCQTKSREMSGKRLTVDEVVKEVKKDILFYENSGGGVTFCGGEPTMQKDYLLELMQACYDEGIDITLDTCGYCNHENFKAFIPYVNLFLFDCKLMNAKKHQQYTEQDNELILENLKFLLQHNKNVHIRIPLIPEVNDTEENVQSLANFIHDNAKNSTNYSIDILPYHEYGKSKYKALGLEFIPYKSYTPTELNEKVQLFEKYNLKVNVVI